MLTADNCHACGSPTLCIRDGKLYRKDRLVPSTRDEERCEVCGTATPKARERGHVDLWIADSVGTH